MNSRALDYTALVIALIGAVNWGLIGFFRFNLVTFLFGDMVWVTRIIYALVGIADYIFLPYSEEFRLLEKRCNSTAKSHHTKSNLCDGFLYLSCF